jgi:hypothetical protein
MTTTATIEILLLEEIHDLGWPTDDLLVASFRRTVQQGVDFAPIQVNRLWLPDATWRYEIIDGFHRFEAAKAEGLTSLCCQVVELEERPARYARIHACIGKPAQVTNERALQELRRAFVMDLRAALGDPEPLYEPVLGEDGQVHACPRTAPLPEEPLQALEVFADHLLATTVTGPLPPDPSGQRVGSRTPFGPRTGWEALLTEWLADLGKRFGQDATWLLGVLRIQVLQDQGFGQHWTARQREAFRTHGSYGFTAINLWNIPDVDLRARFRRTLQAQPTGGYVFSMIMARLGLHGGPQAGKPFRSYPKSVLLTLLDRYPNLRDLERYLREHPRGLPLDLATPEAPIPPDMIRHPPALPTAPSLEPANEQQTEPSVFGYASRSFFASPLQAERGSASAIPPEPKPLPDPSSAYQPVHVACQAFLRAVQHLTEQYGRDWLTWEEAQTDLARLRAAITPS